MQRNVLLDGMRGIAASMVVLFHLGYTGLPQLAASGHLAVDFFFVLSGFVISGAFEDRFKEGLSVPKFMQLRLLRFYPLYFVGLCLGLAKTIIAPRLTDQAAAAALFGILMLPFPGSDRLYPLNTPSWSLFFELLVNLFFALVLARASLRLLGLFMIGALFILISDLNSYLPLNVGVAWDSAVAGAARTIFSFTAGVVIWRLSKDHKTYSGLAVPLIILLLCVLAVPTERSWRTVYELSVGLIVCPVIVWFGARTEAPIAIRGALTWLGQISFPLYAIHYPLMGLAMLICRRLGISPIVSELIFLGVLFVLSWLLASFFDNPIQRRFRPTLKIVSFRRSEPANGSGQPPHF